MGREPLALAIFLTLTSGVLLLFLDRSSAEFVITVTTFIMASLLLAGVVWKIRRG